MGQENPKLRIANFLNLLFDQLRELIGHHPQARVGADPAAVQHHEFPVFWTGFDLPE